MAGGCQVGTDLAKAPPLPGHGVRTVEALRQSHGLGVAAMDGDCARRALASGSYRSAAQFIDRSNLRGARGSQKPITGQSFALCTIGACHS
jgi:hypothetical protein